MKLTSLMLDLSSDGESNYSSAVCAAKAKKVAGKTTRRAQSSLPPSSPPARSGSEKSQSDVEDGSPSPNRKRRKITDGSEVPVSKKPGTLSSEALEEIRTFADEVKLKADQLGRRFGRSARDILVAAGFGIKPSHNKVNEANLFRSWYWATQPKPEGGKPLPSSCIFVCLMHILRQQPGTNLTTRSRPHITT